MYKKKTINNRFGMYCILPIVVLLLSVAIYLRFFDIAIIGVDGVDNFQYWRISSSWAKGNFDFKVSSLGKEWEFYRPVAYFIYSTAIKFIGYNDYALKVVNSCFDIINIVLIFFVGNRLSNAKIAFMAAFLYAFLPIAIENSKIELLHIIAETFLLLSILFFLKFISGTNEEKHKLGLIFLWFSGFVLSLGTNVHPSLIFLVPAFIVYLLLFSFFIKEIANRIKYILLIVFIFCSSVLLPYVVGGIYYGFYRVYYAIVGLSEAVSGNKINYLFGMWKRCNYYMIDTIGTSLFLFIFIISIISLIVKLLFEFNEELMKNKMIIFTTLLIISFFLGNHFFAYMSWAKRLFLPLVPIMIIHVFLFVYSISTKNSIVSFNICEVTILPLRRIFQQSFSDNRFLLIIFITFFVLFNTYLPIGSYSINSKPSIYREIHDKFHTRVNKENKILLAPYELRDTRGFNMEFYFGENAIYLNEEKMSFDQIFVENHIKYIFWAKDNDNGIRRKISQNSTDVIPVYGITNKDYDPEWERKFIFDRVAEKNSIKIAYESSSVLVYELTPL